MLPYALRDPYRLSHFKSDLYRPLWPDAKAYLINLNNSANVGLLDMIMPGWQDYALSLDRMCSSVWAGTDPKAASQTAAAEWDADHRAARRRLPEGVLRRIPEAARLLCRPYGRELGMAVKL